MVEPAPEVQYPVDDAPAVVAEEPLAAHVDVVPPLGDAAPPNELEV
jgi:hypothetical protein